MNPRLAYNTVAYCVIWFLWLAGVSFWLGVALAAGFAVVWALVEMGVQEIQGQIKHRKMRREQNHDQLG